jgi:hypothetical protein
MGLRGNRRRARFKVVFNEVNQLNGPPLRGRVMGSHRLTEGEVLVAKGKRRRKERSEWRAPTRPVKMAKPWALLASA